MLLISIRSMLRKEKQLKPKSLPDEEVYSYKMEKNGEFTPYLLPYKRRTFEIPKPHTATRRVKFLEKELSSMKQSNERSQQFIRIIGRYFYNQNEAEGFTQKVLGSAH